MDVSYVAQLAKLTLSDDQKAKLTKQLEDTLKLLDQVGKIDTKDVAETSQVTGLANVIRDDVIDKSRILPLTGFFKVPAIFE